MKNNIVFKHQIKALIGLLFLCFFCQNLVNAQQNSAVAPSVFRAGPNKNGVYPGADFNSIKATKWQFKTGAAVRSSPTFDQGKVYAGSSDGFLYCLDAANGKKIWAFNAAAAVQSSPAVSKDKVFFTNKKNQLFALHKITGQKIWQVDLKPDLPYAWGFDYYQSSPLVNAGVVYVGSGSAAVYALNELDGKIKWSFPTSSLVRSSPSLAQNTLYFGDRKSVV